MQLIYDDVPSLAEGDQLVIGADSVYSDATGKMNVEETWEYDDEGEWERVVAS